MTSTLNWDEFRLIKAIADARLLVGAAETLGLNHSTVFRRLAALEAAIGAPLFERRRAGYQPTSAGEEMIALARSMAGPITDFERRVAGRDVRPTGELRVTTVDAMATYFAPLVFARFRALNPGINLEVILSSQILNLSRREAEVAIRATSEPQEALIGRKICTLRWSVYGSPTIKAAYGSRAVAEAPWIGFGENYGPASGRRWIKTRIAKGRQAYKVNSLLSMAELAAQGAGAAILPCFVGDQRPELRRLGETEPDLDVGLWILTHADLRHSARVRAFMDFAGAELTKMRGLIEGDGVEPAIAAAS